MRNPPILAHGGSGEEVLARYFPDAPRPWLDLSTGINPVAYPIGEISTAAWNNLPSPRLYRDCRAAAANYFGAEPCNVAILPGSQAVISLLPRLFAPTSVAVLEPGYGEHALCWWNAGHNVERIPAGQASRSDAAVLVLTNPNNPDGHIWAAKEIAHLATERTTAARWLVVDEAFVDVAPEITAARSCGRSNLIVFRSFGKFFGLAGARLGFAIAPVDRAKALEDMIGPWAVSGPALELGARAYADQDWQRETRRRLARDTKRMISLLERYGLHYVGGTSLFSLVVHERAAALFERFCEAGIYVRRLAQNPNWLRFGLPPDEDDFGRIEAVLQGWARSA